MKLRKRFSRTLLLLLFMLTLALAGTTAHAATSGRWVTSKSAIRYKLSNGTYVKKKFKKIGSNWYYFNASGNVVTGLKTINEKQYYFAKSGKAGQKGRMLTGWITIKGKKYYFRKSGSASVKGSAYKSEWVTLSGKQYYFNCDGTLNTNTMTEEEFIAMVGKLAREDMKKSGILASVTIAQAILESGYGTTSLGMEAHNLFGMKADLSNSTWTSAWKGKTFTKSTKEYLNKKWYTVTAVFRSYNSFAESIADHSAYLSGAMKDGKLRYEGVVGNTSYKSTIKLIKKGGYATDPKYVTKLCNIIKRFNLTQYDH